MGSAQALREQYEAHYDLCWDHVGRLRELEKNVRTSPHAIRAQIEQMAPAMELWDQQNKQVQQLGIINNACTASTQWLIAQFRQKKAQLSVNQLADNMGQLSLHQR